MSLCTKKSLLVIMMCMVMPAIGQDFMKIGLPKGFAIDSVLGREILQTVNCHSLKEKSGLTFYKVIFITEDWKIFRNFISGKIESRERDAVLLSRRSDGSCSAYFIYFYQMYDVTDYSKTIGFNFDVLAKENNRDGKGFRCPCIQ